MYNYRKAPSDENRGQQWSVDIVCQLSTWEAEAETKGLRLTWAIKWNIVSKTTKLKAILLVVIVIITYQTLVILD